MEAGLVSPLMVDDNIEYQICNMEKYLMENQNKDILIFPEAFLQGFNGLSWNYEEDREIAIESEALEIDYIRKICREYGTGVSFSYLENYQGKIYCSNIVIDKEGKILDQFRRVSPGWKQSCDENLYREGDDFHTFTLGGKKCLVAICGDLWLDDNIERINSLEPELIIWPVYIDYSVEDWKAFAREEYKEQTAKLNSRVLMVNSYLDGGKGAKGGAYVFHRGQVVEELSLGNIGVLDLKV